MKFIWIMINQLSVTVVNIMSTSNRNLHKMMFNEFHILFPVKKFKAMNWTIEGAVRIAKRYQHVLSEAEYGEGWGAFISKVLQDYLSQDKGAFVELIGGGNLEGPMEGPVIGIAHLDSGRCQLTGDPSFPVLFYGTRTGQPHKLHATRVIHLVDMPSPLSNFSGIGFCSVSRVGASSQVLLRLAKYKNEKLSDLPPAGLALFNNITMSKFEDATARYKAESQRRGSDLWKTVMTLFSLDPAHEASVNFVSFADLPDHFDELASVICFCF